MGILLELLKDKVKALKRAMEGGDRVANSLSS
jgi:hypothetical protein